LLNKFKINVNYSIGSLIILASFIDYKNENTKEIINKPIPLNKIIKFHLSNKIFISKNFYTIIDSYTLSIISKLLTILETAPILV
jgi:hypothetical protein